MARSPHGARWLIAIATAFALALALAWIAPHTAEAQGRSAGKTSRRDKGKAKPRGKSKGKGKDEVKVFDFTGIDIAGQLRTPQLLYFLDRANEELERASLERRSFIPEMVRSVDEEAL